MLFIALIIALLVPLSLWTRRFLRVWAPTNILLDRFRDRPGAASAGWSLLVGAVYLTAACALAGLVDQGLSGWLNLPYFPFLWNAAKFGLYGGWMIEFAGRLQRDQFSSEPMSVELALHNIRGFVLVAADRNRSGLHSTYMYNDDTWGYELFLSPEEGLTSPRELALDAALDLLQRFNWRGVTRELLQGIQVEVFGPEQP